MRCGYRWPVTVTARRSSAARGRTRWGRTGAGAATPRRPAGRPGRYRRPGAAGPAHAPTRRTPPASAPGRAGHGSTRCSPDAPTRIAAAASSAQRTGAAGSRCSGRAAPVTAARGRQPTHRPTSMSSRRSAVYRAASSDSAAWAKSSGPGPSLLMVIAVLTSRRHVWSGSSMRRGTCQNACQKAAGNRGTSRFVSGRRKPVRDHREAGEPAHRQPGCEGAARVLATAGLRAAAATRPVANGAAAGSARSRPMWQPTSDCPGSFTIARIATDVVRTVARTVARPGRPRPQLRSGHRPLRTTAERPKPGQRHHSGERQGQDNLGTDRRHGDTVDARSDVTLSPGAPGRFPGPTQGRRSVRGWAAPWAAWSAKTGVLPTPDNIPVRDVTSSHARRSSGPRRPRTGGWSREGARNRPPRAARQPGRRQMHLRPRPPTTVP